MPFRPVGERINPCRRWTARFGLYQPVSGSRETANSMCDLLKFYRPVWRIGFPYSCGSVPRVALYTLINPRPACAAKVTVLGLPVCLSVSSYSRTTGYEAAHERYQRLQKYANLKNNMAIFREICHEHLEKANLHNRTSLPRPIRLLFVPCGGTRSHHEGRVSPPASAFYLIV